MASPVRVLGFAGALRKASCNRGLLRAAARLLPPDMSMEVHEIGDIPLYNGDVEAQGFPEPVKVFREKIRAADALLVACPYVQVQFGKHCPNVCVGVLLRPDTICGRATPYEYNYSVPGVLKNAIDWASRSSSATDPQPFSGKACAIMGAGGYMGASRAQYHFRNTAVFLNLYIVNQPEVQLRIAEHFDANGDLKPDKAVETRIQNLLLALAKFSRRLRGV